MSQLVHNDTIVIKDLARRLAVVQPRDAGGVALLGLMAGVLYSLERATEFGFDDARMIQRVNDEKIEIRHTLDALNHGRTPARPWLAGFYLVSAIMRLATLNERIDKYAGVKRDLATDIRKTVNDIKHEIDAGIAAGWNIRFAEVLQSTKDLCGLLEQVLR